MKNRKSDPPSSDPRARSSFRDVYDRTFSFVFRTARRLGVDDRDLDDVTQEVFLTVYRRLPDFEGRSSLKTWVSSILSNVVQNYRRGQRRKGTTMWAPAIDPEDLAAAYGDPWEFIERAQARFVLQKLLDQLSKDIARVFVMVEIEGMTGAEVAALTKANVDTTYSRLRIARRQFGMALARMRGGKASCDKSLGPSAWG